ncbi:MAG: acetyl-/propionyl-CoA carboxylase subunit alpha, partial [Acidimicrobiaceae bacterium]|nr:acetyl-/propionyl-CoA carboxylase subunit alpha [Acidimicrobiaceae bacterium]
MAPGVLLVANRAEVAVRVLRTATELGWGAVAVASADDGACLHARIAPRTIPLPGRGPSAYLDPVAIV